jgi:hypothetical protein
VGRHLEPGLRQFELIGTLHESGMTELPPGSDVPVSAAWRNDGPYRPVLLLDLIGIRGRYQEDASIKTTI